MITDYNKIDIIIDELMTGSDVQMVNGHHTYVTDAKEIMKWYLVENLTPAEISDTAAEIKRLDGEGE